MSTSSTSIITPHLCAKVRRYETTEIFRLAPLNKYKTLHSFDLPFVVSSGGPGKASSFANCQEVVSAAVSPPLVSLLSLGQLCAGCLSKQCWKTYNLPQLNLYRFDGEFHFQQICLPSGVLSWSWNPFLPFDQNFPPFNFPLPLPFDWFWGYQDCCLVFELLERSL